MLREWVDTSTRAKTLLIIDRQIGRILREPGLDRVCSCRRGKTVNVLGETHSGDLMGKCVSAIEIAAVLQDSSFSPMQCNSKTLFRMRTGKGVGNLGVRGVGISCMVVCAQGQWR